MINNFSSWNNFELCLLFITSSISVITYFLLIKQSFNENICFLFKKLFSIKDKQPILYSYRHICLMILSYFLIIASFFALNLFYLIIELYAYYNIQIDYDLILYSETAIKVAVILCATLNIISIILYYIRNNDSSMKFLRNNYCLLEAFLSLLLCGAYIAAIKFTKPMNIVNNDLSNFFTFIIIGYVILDAFLWKLQSSKKESLRKILFGSNSKIKELMNISRNGDIALLYNILVCDGLATLIIFYTAFLGNITILKAISYVLLNFIFIGITKRFKISIDKIIQTKEIK
jgi:hypothetical protein